MLFGLDLQNWRESELAICTVVFGQSTSILKNVDVSDFFLEPFPFIQSHGFSNSKQISHHKATWSPNVCSKPSLVPHRRYFLAPVYLRAHSQPCPCFFCSVHEVSEIKLCSLALEACEISSLWCQSPSQIHCVPGYLHSRGIVIALCFHLGGPYSRENFKLIVILCPGLQPVYVVLYCSLTCHFQVSALYLLSDHQCRGAGGRFSLANYFMRFLACQAFSPFSAFSWYLIAMVSTQGRKSQYHVKLLTKSGMSEICVGAFLNNFVISSRQENKLV